MIAFRFRRPHINLFDSKRNLILLVIFLLVFPKGGIKIAGIPLTWGYFLLGIFSIGSLLRKAICVQKKRLYALICLVPFLFISALTMIGNGIESPEMALSFWISFLFLPVFFLCFFSKDIDTFNDALFFNLFTKGIFFIAVYGIALFFIKYLTGRFLEIPLLTMNLGDLGQLEHKHINRGGVFKLISTYNNGNLYGICLLMLLPLYCFFERKNWRIWIVKLSLFMTLSRTVWIGLFFHEICYQWLMCKNKKTFFTKAFLSVLLFMIGLIALSLSFGFSWHFFADATFGGRKSQLELISQTGLFSNEPFNGFSEIVYASMVTAFGWIGLATFLFAIVGPLLFELFSRSLSKFHQAIALGLVNYLLIAGSDGAILLLPTMAFFWFLLSLLYRKDASSSDMRAENAVI